MDIRPSLFSFFFHTMSQEGQFQRIVISSAIDFETFHYLTMLDMVTILGTSQAPQVGVDAVCIMQAGK